MIKGRAWCFGDNLDTDVIIPGKYLRTRDLSLLAHHVLEGLDPQFASKVKKGDIIVAGRNFGCGSSREQAALALKEAGVAAIIATRQSAQATRALRDDDLLCPTGAAPRINCMLRPMVLHSWRQRRWSNDPTN